MRHMFCTFLPFFFLIPRPPPRSTLFPYTTLFRSQPQLHADRRRDRGLLPQSSGRARSGNAQWPRDRKSTRLNSSHVSISYAVFCLKKKKKHKSSANSTLYTSPREHLYTVGP